MELVLGILILLAICGSRAAQNGLTLLIGVPLGLVAALVLVGMLWAGANYLTTATAPQLAPAPAVIREAYEPDEARNAHERITLLRQRYSTDALP